MRQITVAACSDPACNVVQAETVFVFDEADFAFDQQVFTTAFGGVVLLFVVGLTVGAIIGTVRKTRL